jgi:hypothetical protein
MTEQEAIEFCKNDPKSAAKIILMVEDLKKIIITQKKKIEELEIIIKEQDIRIKELEAKLNKNSSNSSKPPSSDNKLKISKKNNNNKKKMSNKKRGGQSGRAGKNLKMVEYPDKTVKIKPTLCNCCNRDISSEKSQELSKRQVFDIPSIKIEITEFQ